MKKTLLVVCSALALNMQAEVITLDLTQPTTPSVIEFSEEDIWVGTNSSAADYGTLDFQVFSFIHYGHDVYWNGFTVSKIGADTLNNNACMGKGGLAGQGTPFVLGYWSEWSAATEPNQVIFNDGNAYYPQTVSVCQNPISYNAIVNGDSYARKFAAGDYFTLTISPLDENYEEDTERKVVYYMADYRSEQEADWTINAGWEQVDLSSLGACYGLSFTMQSTDIGGYGINTATYFALDGLSVSTDVVSSVSAVIAPDAIAEWQVYSIAGQYLMSATTTLNDLRESLAAGVYVVRSGEYAQKIAK